jgi:hypothetical protein
VEEYKNFELIDLLLYKLPWFCYAPVIQATQNVGSKPSHDNSVQDEMATYYGRKFAPCKVHGKNFGLYEKLAMAVFPLCVPYVHHVIKNLFSHIGRFVYVNFSLKLSNIPLFGSLGHLYSGQAETLLNYINQQNGATPSRWSCVNQCSPFPDFDVPDFLIHTSLLAAMSNFNRKRINYHFHCDFCN